MLENGPKPGPSSPPSSDNKALEGWKEIADYLDREVRTVQRWEKSEGLPIRRHEHQKKATVYAYPSELNDWRETRQPRDDPEADAAFEPEPEEAEEISPSAPDLAPAAPALAVVAGQPSSADTDAAKRRHARLARRLGAALIGASLVALLSFAYFKTSHSFLRSVGKVRLVVLPFANISGDPKQDYFSAGLTDEMITQLGSLDPQRLGVIAAVSSSALAGKPIAEIRRALDVQYVLEGSVRRDVNRVRIDVQLIQASDQTHLWADSYDRDLNDILSVQNEVATAVAGQIRLALNPSSGKGSGAVVTPRSVNPEAYDAYLRGRFYWTNRGDIHKSIEAYQQAIQKDPQYALAYAGLANGYALMGQVPYDDLPPAEAKPKAKEAAEHALQLDPQLSEAHTALANVAFSYDWDFETAEREFQRAVALGPNDPTPHLWYGHYCIVRNRLPQALEENSHTLELDPVSPVFNTVRAQIEYSARDYDAAIEQGMRVVEEYWIGPISIR